MLWKRICHFCLRIEFLRGTNAEHKTAQDTGFVKRPADTKEKGMKSVFGGKICLVLALATFVFSAPFSLAQGIVTGTISGVVEDAQGAVVPNATVTVTHLATNRVFTTQTTSAGIIALRDLPPGEYNLKINAPSFRAFESKNLSVDVGKDTGMGTVKLTVGSSTESVTVEGTAPLIES